MINRLQSPIAFVYGTQAGAGGLGAQSANAIAGLAIGSDRVHAFGPGYKLVWPLTLSENIVWHQAPVTVPGWAVRFTPFRWRQGDLQYQNDVGLGQWAAKEIERLRPEICYAFTQVALESLRWARRAGIPAILESPNGHIRYFRSVYERETERWCGQKYNGHPSMAMVERVEEEYELADRIRVSSEWSKQSLIDGGVPVHKIIVLQQPVNLHHFQPKPENHHEPQTERLRICFVGSLDLRKGFVYLLQAAKAIGTERVELEFVGATGNRCCAQLFARESIGVRQTCQPGNPLPAYHRADLFVLPTLEDGSPFAVAEAMACGLPVIVTDSCGSAEWVRSGLNGWIVPSGRVEPLAAALQEASVRRDELCDMGKLARTDTENRVSEHGFTALNQWIECKFRSQKTNYFVN